MKKGEGDYLFGVSPIYWNRPFNYPRSHFFRSAASFFSSSLYLQGATIILPAATSQLQGGVWWQAVSPLSKPGPRWSAVAAVWRRKPHPAGQAWPAVTV